MVRSYANIEEMLTFFQRCRKSFGRTRETPFKSFKEKQEEGMHSDTTLEKQVNALNESFINFFKGFLIGVGNPHVNKAFIVCQICRSNDHIGTACPQIGDLKRKSGKCGHLHKTKLCGIKCGYSSRMGHIENRCWKH